MTSCTTCVKPIPNRHADHAPKIPPDDWPSDRQRRHAPRASKFSEPADDPASASAREARQPRTILEGSIRMFGAGQPASAAPASSAAAGCSRRRVLRLVAGRRGGVRGSAWSSTECLSTLARISVGSIGWAGRGRPAGQRSAAILREERAHSPQGEAPRARAERCSHGLGVGRGAQVLGLGAPIDVGHYRGVPGYFGGAGADGCSGGAGCGLCRGVGLMGCV